MRGWADQSFDGPRLASRLAVKCSALVVRRGVVMRVFARLVFLLVMSGPFAFNYASIAQPKRALAAAAPIAQKDEADIRDRLNAWSIGLAGGLLEGAPIHFATEIARVVNDGGNMHVLPIVTRGPTENVNDLLYLQGVDAAIINSNSLEEYKAQVPQIAERISAVLSLFPSELHIFVRPEIQIARRPRRQEGELQHAGHCGGLFRDP